MQIERAILGVKTLGPGERFAIWVNGCYRKCVGCVSERLQQFNPLNEQDVISFLSQFDLMSITGATVSGGEPFEQYHDLCKMVKYFKEHNINDILIYTGYTYEELLSKNKAEIDYILDNIAVLIDGPYVQKLDSGYGNLKGSDNQRIIFLNEKFKTLYEGYYCKERTMQEFFIGNTVIGIGIPNKDYIDKFKNNKGD